MPMPNLRHNVKSGRKDRRTGTAVSNADRCVLPPIPARQPTSEQDLRDVASSRARPPSAYVRLPAIQPETPVYQPKPPAGGKPRRTRGTSGRLSVIQETPARRPSRLPVLVRNDTTRFNNAPTYEAAAPKATKTSTRRSSVFGYGVSSGDMDNMISQNEHTRSSTRDRHKRSRRRGSGHTSDDDDAHASYKAEESGEPWNIHQVDPARRATIEHYAKVFDVLVLATSWKLEYDKIEDKKRKENVNDDIEAYQNSD